MVKTLLDLPDAQLWFEDFDQLRAWVDQEAGKWSWLGQNSPYIDQVWNNISGTYQELRNNIEINKRDGQPLHTSISAVHGRISNGPLVYSGSIEGSRILDIYTSNGPEAAAAAFGMFRGLLSFQNMRGLQSFKGMMEFAYPALSPVEKLRNDIAVERTILRRMFSEMGNRSDRAEEERERRARKTWWLVARRYVKRQGQMNAHFQDLDDLEGKRLAEREKEFLERVEAFKATEATYKDQMELQAPVTYWESKASKHKDQERGLLRWVVGYFAITIPAVVVLFGLAGGWLLGIPAGGGKLDSAMYVVVGAGLAAVTTLVLWAGRLLTRFYLSQNHLHHDANDRAVMTRTYLALTSVRQADEKDRAIILAALFRPSADGIVKDDGAPDLGVAGVASKILTGGR